MSAIRKGTQDFNIEMKLGHVTGYRTENKFGADLSVTNGQWDIVSSTSISGTFPSSGITVRIKSGGDIADTFNGAGARSITVVGLNEQAEEVSEIIVTSGSSASLPTETIFRRLYRAFNTEVGTDVGANVGDIVIEKSDGTDDMLTILADEGQTQHCAYTIGADKRGLLRSVHVYVDGNKAADVRIFIRENYTDVSVPFTGKKLKLFFPGVLVSDKYKPNAPDVVLNEFTDIWAEARGTSQQTSVSVKLEILIVDNESGPIQQA